MTWTKRLTTAAIALLLVLAGSTVAFASWAAGATATSTVTTPRVAVSQQGFASLGFTLGNAVLVSSGSFIVTNTGSAPGSMTVTLGTAVPTDAGLAAALDVSVWPATDIASCSGIPVSPITGTWASPLTTPATTLAPGASASYCVRAAAAERSLIASTGGTLTVTPQVTANLTVGGWTATAAASATQITKYVWPNAVMTPGSWYKLVNTASGMCVDVNGGVATPGTTVIQWVCKTTGMENQRWSFTSTGDNYYTVFTQSSSTAGLALVGAGAGDTATVQTIVAAQPNQNWQAQYQGAGHYQLVVRSTGMCLQSPGPTATNEFTQALCDGSTAQQFTVTADPIVVSPLTCSTKKNDATFSWTPAAVTQYSWRVNTAGGTIPIASTSFTTSTAATAGWADGTYPVEVTDSQGVLRHTGNLKVSKKGTKLACG